MAISYPRTDILSTVEMSADSQPPMLLMRQEYSRQAGGRTIGKDFGSALWQMSFVTIPIENDDAIDFEAILDSLDGVILTFEAYDVRRKMPRLYPTGACNDGVLASVNANSKAISLSGLAAGQVISRGDWLSFDYGANRALHRVVEAATANGAGLTPQFEVRPHLRPGWTLSTAVKLKNPRGIFVMMPGSVSPKAYGSLHTVISFQAIQFIA